jgi:hypothetical protein
MVLRNYVKQCKNVIILGGGGGRFHNVCDDEQQMAHYQKKKSHQNICALGYIKINLIN